MSVVGSLGKILMTILGIETSCDETAASVVRFDGKRFDVHSNVIASQVKLHAETRGVVPEVAAREHVRVILPIIDEALRGIPRDAKKIPEIERVAVTAGPGLMTSLVVGVETAKTLARVWEKPLVVVNHIEGHLVSSQFTLDVLSPLPALALIASGGHTELVFVPTWGQYKKLGATRDDAAGEAFDKVAKLLGLEYPGGPIISEHAKRGDPTAISFPRSMINSHDFDFSFSGLKTAVLYYTREHGLPTREQELDDLCASFEQAVVDVLIAKTIRAAREKQVRTILLGGGVAANCRLRENFKRTAREELDEVAVIIPEMSYTTDNAAMIAAASVFHEPVKDFTFRPDPQWSIEDALRSLFP
jgi:N6-L-threonylcarbamoyladenine synthase